MTSTPAGGTVPHLVTTDLLAGLGWTAQRATDFAEHAAPGRIPGRVARADGATCTVLTALGPLRAQRRAGGLRGVPAAGAVMDPTLLPAVGDWVAVRTGTDAEGHAVVAVLPRTSSFVRGTADDRTLGQVLATNVDTALVVVGLATPPNLRRVERFLALAWESGARPVVVLTKSDLCDDVAQAVADVEEAAPGVGVLAVSARTGEGLAALAQYVEMGQTVVLLGASGVGKSTLVNTLAGADVMRTHEIRDDGKGRHTTTHRELVVLPGGGVLIDTPGLRGVQLWDAEEGVELAFSDVESLAEGCRFHDCAHDSEPGCAVVAAVEAGVLAPARVASYRKLQREVAWLARRKDARARSEAARRWKQVSKAQRAAGNRP
jgi:ribosome biogenesis GTPase / thiamine phosphate phosphatase